MQVISWYFKMKYLIAGPCAIESEKQINEIAQMVKASGGNKNVILCERGIRTFEDSTRFTLDIAAVPVVKSKSNFDKLSKEVL